MMDKPALMGSSSSAGSAKPISITLSLGTGEMAHPCCMGEMKDRAGPGLQRQGEPPKHFKTLVKAFLVFVFLFILLWGQLGTFCFRRNKAPTTEKQLFVYFFNLPPGAELCKIIRWITGLFPNNPLLPGSWRMVPSEKTLNNFSGSWLTVYCVYSTCTIWGS